jgi:sec-independent protein translocase protein TatB
MFDFDIGKMMVVAVVALAVIPPKDLPRVMRTVGQFVGKMRRMAAEFQGQFMDAMREADLDSVRKELEELKEKTRIHESFDPVAMVRDDVKKAADAAGIGSSTVSLEKATPSGFELPHTVEPPSAPSVESSIESLPGPPVELTSPAPDAGVIEVRGEAPAAEPAPAKQSAAE